MKDLPNRGQKEAKTRKMKNEKDENLIILGLFFSAIQAVVHLPGVWRKT